MTLNRNALLDALIGDQAGPSTADVNAILGSTVKQRGSLLPLVQYEDNSVGVGMPEWLNAPVTSLGNMLSPGYFDFMTAPEGTPQAEEGMRNAIMDSTNVAGAAVGGGTAFPKPANSLGIFGGRLGRDGTVSFVDAISGAPEGQPMKIRSALGTHRLYSKKEAENAAEELSKMSNKESLSVKGLGLRRKALGPVIEYRGDIDGNKLYRVKIPYKGDTEYHLENAQGNPVSSAVLVDNTIGYVSTAPEYQRQGWMTKLYDAIERDAGVKLSPSGEEIHPATQHYWQKRQGAR